MIEAIQLPQDEVWLDPSRSPEARVDDLLARLTLAEKVGQLGSRWVLNDMTATGEPDDEESEGLDQAEVMNVAPMQDVFAASGTLARGDLRFRRVWPRANTRRPTAAACCAAAPTPRPSGAA